MFNSSVKTNTAGWGVWLATALAVYACHAHGMGWMQCIAIGLGGGAGGFGLLAAADHPKAEK